MPCCSAGSPSFCQRCHDSAAVHLTAAARPATFSAMLVMYSCIVTRFFCVCFCLGCAAEIERTLKRVEEGIAAFDEQLERVHEADSQALKERHEEELKKEIKKLQRYRDAIKIWQNGSDVKQKQPLIDARAAIERRMETFKMVERETKTKAYSKEGLARDNTLTAEEKKRLRTREWVQELVQQLSDDADATEAEVEALETAAATAGGGAKAKKDREATLTRLAGIITNHRWHIERLEALTRMLDNERVDPDEVDAIRDDLSYYVEQVRSPLHLLPPLHSCGLAPLPIIPYPSAHHCPPPLPATAAFAVAHTHPHAHLHTRTCMECLHAAEQGGGLRDGRCPLRRLRRPHPRRLRRGGRRLRLRRLRRRRGRRWRRAGAAVRRCGRSVCQARYARCVCGLCCASCGKAGR